MQATKESRYVVERETSKKQRIGKGSEVMFERGGGTKGMTIATA